ERIDALAVSARAILAPVRNVPAALDRRDGPLLSESPSIEIGKGRFAESLRLNFEDSPNSFLDSGDNIAAVAALVAPILAAPGSVHRVCSPRVFTPRVQTPKSAPQVQTPQVQTPQVQAPQVQAPSPQPSARARCTMSLMSRE